MFFKQERLPGNVQKLQKRLELFGRSEPLVYLR